MFTRNLCLTPAAHAIMEGHVAVYNTLWPSFLSDPVAAPEKAHVHLPFQFVGGLGLPARQIAISLAFAGALGIPLQIFGYSRVAKRLGMLRMWRIFLKGFPIVYLLIPYLSVIPSSSPSACSPGRHLRLDSNFRYADADDVQCIICRAFADCTDQ